MAIIFFRNSASLWHRRIMAWAAAILRCSGVLGRRLALTGFVIGDRAWCRRDVFSRRRPSARP